MDTKQLVEDLKKAAIEAYLPASEQFVMKLIDEVLEKALMQVVADSENKIDDALAAVVYPKLEEALKAELVKLFAKLK